MEDKKPEEKKKSDIYAEKASEDYAKMEPTLMEMKKKLEAVKGELVSIGNFAKTLFSYGRNKLSEKAMKAIEDIDADIQAKKDEIDSRFQGFQAVGKTSRTQTEKIQSARSALDKRSEKFAEKEETRSESAVLRGAARTGKAYNKGMTLVGEIAARVAKTPNTIAARVAALRGDDEAVKTNLEKSSGIADKVMGAIKKTTAKNQVRLQKRVTAFNQVDARSTKQGATITSKARDGLDRVDDFITTQEENGFIRGGVAEIMGVSQATRVLSGNIRAQLVQRGMDALAKGSAVLGATETAKTLSQKGGKVSREIMDKATSRNTRAQAEFSGRMDTFDSVGRRTDEKVASLDKSQDATRQQTDKWRARQKSEGVTSRGIMNITGVVTQGITGVTKLYAQGDMRVTEAVAKGAAILGYRKKAQEMVNRAKTRSTENIRGAEGVNKKVRSGATQVMSFKDRKKAQIMELGGRIEKGIGTTLDTIDTGIEKGIDWVEKGIDKGLEAAEEGISKAKTNAALVQNKVIGRYNKGRVGFFTALKNGPGKLMTTLAETFNQGLDNTIEQSEAKAIAASNNVTRLQEEAEK